jgi:hypothetical protein
MAANVFVSFDHDDQQQVAGFKLLKANPGHPLDFRDHSLKAPILGPGGKPITYPPSDARSKPVRDEIIDKFGNASKLVVLIGTNTCNSEWVAWEVNTFFKMKQPLSGANTWKRIRGMTLKGCNSATIPAVLGDQSTKVLAWNPEALDTWLDQDPDA